jgi:hypothetical protein
LEVTAIVASKDESGARASDELSKRLTRVAEAESLGTWMVAVEIDRDFRLLEPEILKIIRDAQPIRERLLATRGSIHPGDYANDLARLPRALWASLIAEHARLRELGLNDVAPVRTNRENFVGVLPVRGAVIRRFEGELQERVNAKADVLGEVVDLERHLAVLVHRWDVSGDADSTPVPQLPPTIDVLWVVHRWQHDREHPEIWITRRSRPRWSVHAQG